MIVAGEGGGVSHEVIARGVGMMAVSSGTGKSRAAPSDVDE